MVALEKQLYIDQRLSEVAPALRLAIEVMQHEQDTLERRAYTPCRTGEALHMQFTESQADAERKDQLAAAICDLRALLCDGEQWE